MIWNNLKKCLEEYSMYLLQASRNNMPTYYELKDKINFVMNVNGAYYDIEFRGPDYWKYANDGRRPGKMPPKAPIDDWIRRRNITPYALKNGKLPTKDQLSFLIRRSIADNGFDGIHFLEKSIDEQKTYWDDKISSAIADDIIFELDSWFSSPLFEIK